MSDRESRSPDIVRHSNGSTKRRRSTHDRKRSRDSRSRSFSRSPKRLSSGSHRRKPSRRSRSRSGSRRRVRHSRSRSRSYTPYSASKPRRRSRSGSRDRNLVPADGPPPNRCVGVFGMSLYTDEKQLENHFGTFGKIENIQIVYDKQTGRSRGFGFIYFNNVDDAQRAKERSAGVEIDGHRIRVDFSITKRPHTPTPGIYMGKRNMRRDDYFPGGGRGGRSPSPYHSRRRTRSRSRSYS